MAKINVQQTEISVINYRGLLKIPRFIAMKDFKEKLLRQFCFISQSFEIYLGDICAFV